MTLRQSLRLFSSSLCIYCYTRDMRGQVSIWHINSINGKTRVLRHYVHSRRLSFSLLFSFLPFLLRFFSSGTSRRSRLIDGGLYIYKNARTTLVITMCYAADSIDSLNDLLYERYRFNNLYDIVHACCDSARCDKLVQNLSRTLTHLGTLYYINYG